MKDIIIKVVVCLLAYLVGSINFAKVFARFKKVDITKEGSGNPGTMNALRTVGKTVGLLTFIFDILKGLTFALVGRLAYGMGWCFVFGFITVLGHVFPVYSKFKGGKGVATTMGVFLVACPVVGLVILTALIIFAFVYKYGFVGSVGAVTIMSTFATIAFTCIPTIKLAGVNLILALVFNWAIWTLVIFRHKDNFIRLLSGKENTLDILGKNKQDVSNCDNNSDNDNNDNCVQQDNSTSKCKEDKCHTE